MKSLESIRERGGLVKSNILPENIYRNAAGFIHIENSIEELDKSRIHPEMYEVVKVHA